VAVHYPLALQCPDSAGCDICPNGPIIDDSKVVTGAVSEDAEEQTASCAEWFLYGCTFSQSDCAGLQTAAAACCMEDMSSDSTRAGTALVGAAAIGLAMLA